VIHKRLSSHDLTFGPPIRARTVKDRYLASLADAV